MPTPYGSWPSSISASDLADSGLRLDGARFVDGEAWWGEALPAERGRVSVRRRGRTGEVEDVLAAPWSARSRVHEYGGGSWTAASSGALFFVDGEGQRVHRLDPGSSSPVPLTTPGPRYGGLRVEQGRLLAVREDLRPEPHERALVEIPLDGSAAEDDGALAWIARGPGFFAHPTLSPDGSRVAYVTWNERSMPWQSAQLRLADRDGTDVAPVRAGAALQPEWTGENELLFADDPTGRWNLLRLRLEGVQAVSDPEPLAPADADTGGGLWVLGQRWYRPLPDGRVLAVRTHGSDRLVLIDRSGRARTLNAPADAELVIEDVQQGAGGPQALISGRGSRVTSGLWLVDLGTGNIETVRGGDPVDGSVTPPARSMTFPGRYGPVHAFDHPPANPLVSPPAGERAPYVIQVHGGPTAHATGASAPWIAFLTSRGIGVLEVNYGGSSGYGRAYRERLDGRWGVVDVDDVLDAARGLVDAGIADPQRVAVRGGSAGGWTALGALVRGGVFAAGIDRYGVVDARMLAADSHDFERHYLDGLIGPLPEAEQAYVDRSPLTHAERIDVPVLILQGEDDAVVPPPQSEALRGALAARGVPHEYVTYPGEGHGFRRAETIADAARTELRFLGRVFGFSPAPEG